MTIRLWHESTPEQWAAYVLERIAEHRRQEHEEAFVGACLAMSRFMTFVWMEAEAQDEWKAYRHSHPYGMTIKDGRSWWFKKAVETERLRLEWPR